MKRKLFKNYSFAFDKNEAKLIKTFCKQAMNQMTGDDRYIPDVKAFNSIISKLDADHSSVKLTKDEKTRLVLQIKNNANHIKKTMDKSWFIKKWLYRSMYNQYQTLLTQHFNE